MIENFLFLFDKIRHYPICTLSCKLRKTSKSDEFRKGTRSFESGKRPTKWFLQVQMEM